ncbi:MAG: hypothetical protein KGJ90_02195 [Patescibacteria group bacterium]|nr:hypothetical protein [Patescibacteria group bacterium]
MEPEKKKRGRPRKTLEQKEATRTASEAQKEIVEVIKEIIVRVPEPRLEGFELYKTLKDKTRFPQGGSMGQWMEDPNGFEVVYAPSYQEIITFFMADPEKMNQMRDAVIRAYIELYASS